MERAYIFLACQKNVGSLHKKMTRHAFFRRKNSLYLFNTVLSNAHPSINTYQNTKHKKRNTLKIRYPSVFEYLDKD